MQEPRGFDFAVLSRIKADLQLPVKPLAYVVCYHTCCDRNYKRYKQIHYQTPPSFGGTSDHYDYTLSVTLCQFTTQGGAALKRRKLISAAMALLLLTACADDSVPANGYISAESSTADSPETEAAATAQTTTPAQTTTAAAAAEQTKEQTTVPLLTPINGNIDYIAFDSRIDEIAAYCADLISAREKAANLYLNGALSNTPKTWGRTTDYYELYGLGNSYHSAQAELLITTPDLARLGVMLAGDGSLNGKRVLSSEAVELINTTFFPDKGMGFDMGLTVRKYNGSIVEGRCIYGHPGQALGSVNGLFYDPADGTGVAICSVGCSSSVNAANGVYTLLDKCVKEVYRVFFD